MKTDLWVCFGVGAVHTQLEAFTAAMQENLIVATDHKPFSKIVIQI